MLELHVNVRLAVSYKGDGGLMGIRSTYSYNYVYNYWLRRCGQTREVGLSHATYSYAYTHNEEDT